MTLDLSGLKGDQHARYHALLRDISATAPLIHDSHNLELLSRKSPLYARC